MEKLLASLSTFSSSFPHLFALFSYLLLLLLPCSSPGTYAFSDIVCCCLLLVSTFSSSSALFFAVFSFLLLPLLPYSSPGLILLLLFPDVVCWFVCHWLSTFFSFSPQRLDLFSFLLLLLPCSSPGTEPTFVIVIPILFVGLFVIGCPPSPPHLPLT